MLMARLGSVLIGLLVALGVPTLAGAAPKAVVELFTSQGCASCRAADTYFEELAAREDVIALSFHVDYWDYLGWKDTFGSPEHTDRQQEYAQVRDASRIYTPQIIVNGTAEFVGSDRAAIEAAIEAASLPVPVKLTRSAGKIEIEVGGIAIPARWRTTIRLVLFSKEARVQIAEGENAGSTIVYRNVVREIRPIGMWDGGPVSVTLPEHELLKDGVDGCAVIVQEDLTEGPGAILGAAELSNW